MSAAEFFCMILEQIPNVIKIGSTTAAGDGTISSIYLPGFITTIASFLGVYYPDFTPTQRVGIIPDYYVYPTIKGIREGRDEVLEFALNCEFVGVKDIEKEKDIVLYPNPTTGELRFSNLDFQVIGVEIIDLFGRRQKIENITQDAKREVVIDASSLQAGIFFVRIQIENGIITKKIIKQ